MPPKNDFSTQQAEFTKNLGALNKALEDTNSELKSSLADQTKLIKKSGALNVKAMRDHAIEVHNTTRKIKSGAIQKEIELKSDKLEKTVNNLSEATYKLDASSEQFRVSAKELSASNKELSSSMDDVVDITNKNMESLRYVGDNMKKLAKWAVIGGLVGAGYAGYRTLKGAGRLGARAATAPIRAGVGAIKAYGDIQEGAATDILGNVRTDLWGGYKKALGTGLALAGGGLAPGMFFESATANMFGGGGEGGMGGPGIGSRMASGIGGAARYGMGGLQFGVGKLAEFVAGFPRETREKGIFRMTPATGNSFGVTPDEEFSSEFESLSDKIEETNKLISEPDEDIQTKIMTKSFTTAFEESGRSGLFKRMFAGVFKLGSTIAYALPIFGAGYRAELPEVRRYGMFGAMLQTLGMIYVHNRFASEESNKLSLQVARLLQIGFEIPGSLWRPGPRSLSEWIGKTIGDTMSGETGPLTFMKEMITGKLKEPFLNILGMGKEKGTGLLNMIPGYKEWVKTKGVKKESDELRESPSLARRILLWTDIRDTLKEMLDIMNKKGGSAMAKPISLQKASTQPHVITKTGTAELHAGETVGGGSRGGIFSRIFGGIAGLFSGGIFKKIKEWFASIFAPLTSKIDQMLNWFKATFSFLEPAVQAMHEIETAFGIGKTTKVTRLAEGGGIMLEKRGKKTIFGGIFNAIQEVPIILEKALTNIGNNLKEIFSKTLSTRDGIGSIIIKAYQTLIPEIFKKAGGEIFSTVKSVVVGALQATADVTTESSKLLKVLYDYGSKIVKPFQDAWDKGGSPFTKILTVIGAIPKSTWEALKGLIPLGKGLLQSLGNILNATTIMENFSVSVQQASIIDIPNAIAKVREYLIEKILPETWAKLFNSISGRILEWSQVSFKSFMNAFNAMDQAAIDFTEARIKRPGIPGVITGIFKYMFRIIKEAFDPLKTAILNSWNDVIGLGKGIKKYSFSQLIDDFGTLWEKMNTIAKLVQEQINIFRSFVRGETTVPAMAKGGILYAARGVVVGEAGPEAVIPLDDPRATARISGMFSEALGNLGLGTQIINRLDAIIAILGGIPGRETKKAKIVKGTMGIFGKLLRGITDIGVTLAKLPFQIGSDVARGIAKGLSKGVEVVTDIGHTILSAMRTGFTALRHTINAGVTTIKMAMKTAWATISAPFKAIGRFIMRPFQSIRDKYLKFKEGLKEKVKGAIKWLKPGGKTAPIAVDSSGEYVYAKWPALLVKYTKGIYQLLVKKFGFGLPGLPGVAGSVGKGIKGMVSFIKNLAPVIMPYILGAIGIAGVGMSVFDAFRGTKKAREWHGVASGENLRTSQKVTAGLGGFLGGTFENLGARTAWGTAKGAAIGAGVGSIVPGFGTAIGAAIGALAGGILGAIGGKNITKALQAVWEPVKKIAVAVYEFVTWPFRIIGKLMSKFKNWIKGKIPWIDKDKFDSNGEFAGATAEFASGGLITKPTIGLMGERGPEAVIPLNKAPAFARMINDIVMTNPRAIAEHDAILESTKQKIVAKRILEGNKKLQEALASRQSSNVITNQVNNSNSLVNNAVSSAGSRRSFDEETEKILGGRLS